MKVKLENAVLNQVISMFFEMSLKGKHSRHRTRFVQMLDKRLEEVLDEQDIILKEHCHLDEEGNPKTKNEGREYDVKDPVAFSHDRNELYKEKFIIEGEGNKVMLLSIREILDDCPTEFSGTEANLYNFLCEEFKVDEELDFETDGN